MLLSLNMLQIDLIALDNKKACLAGKWLGTVQVWDWDCDGRTILRKKLISPMQLVSFA